MDNVILNKVASIERCLNRVKEEFDHAGNNFAKDITRQDAAILNLLRACEQSIDLANHIVKVKKLGIPQSSRDSFDLLASNSIISVEIANSMKAMIGFRNIAVHNYTNLDIKIVIKIIQSHLGDFRLFTQKVL